MERPARALGPALGIQPLGDRQGVGVGFQDLSLRRPFAVQGLDFDRDRPG
jgi:hypothetical protein